MNYRTISIIVILCYILGEFIKIILKNKKELYKIIPLTIAIIGGVIGAIMYLDDPSSILNANNIYVAIEIGIISGASATGANQIIKQLFIKENKEE